MKVKLKKKFVIKIVLLALIISATQGCRSVKWWSNHCEKCVSVCVEAQSSQTDTLIIEKEVIKMRDTTIFVLMPSDTLIDSVVVVLWRNNKFTSDTLILRNKYTTATAWVFDSKLYGNMFSTVDSLEIELKNAVKETNKYKQLYTHTKTQNTATIYKRKPFDKFTFWWFVGSIALILVVVVLKFK